MARKSTFTVVTRKDDPTYVRMFQKAEEATDWVGPEYDKKGFVVTTFEKKTETVFERVEDETESPTLAGGDEPTPEAFEDVARGVTK